MSSWMPPDWVRHMSGKYDEPPKIEPTSSASMLGRGSGKLLMSSSTTMSSVRMTSVDLPALLQ